MVGPPSPTAHVCSTRCHREAVQPCCRQAGTHHLVPRHPDHMLLQKVQDRREVGCGIQQVEQLIPAGAASTGSAMPHSGVHELLLRSQPMCELAAQPGVTSRCLCTAGHGDWTSSATQTVPSD